MDRAPRNPPSRFSLHITVVDPRQRAWKGTSQLDEFDQTARLVKAALLYADHVTLATPEMPKLAVAVAGASSDPRLHDELRAYLTGRPPSEVHFLEALSRTTSVDEIVRAERAGLLDLYGYRSSDSAQSINGLGAVWSYEYRPIVEDLLSRGRSQSHPLFDQDDNYTVRWLRLIARDVPVSKLEFDPSKRAGLASLYINSIEAFPNASMDTVLDARRLLSAPLIRFRAAIGELTAELQESPLDDGFASQAAELYRRHVAPELEELNYLANEARLLPVLRRELTEVQPNTWLAAALAFAATSAAGLLAQAVASTAPVVGGIAGGMRGRRAEIAEKVRETRFLWLYKATTLLGPRRRRHG